MFNLKRSLIALVGVLVLVVALAAMMPLVSRGQGGNPLNRDTRKSYYLTPTENYTGSQALTACAPGYHMASLWEILDTSNLRYNTDLGFTRADSGFGPPTLTVGWIRTGFGQSTSFTDAGRANCRAWMSADQVEAGAFVSLTADWESTESTPTAISPWVASAGTCAIPRRVWCVQD